MLYLFFFSCIILDFTVDHTWTVAAWTVAAKNISIPTAYLYEDLIVFKSMIS